MTKGRLDEHCDAHQADVEDPLATLGAALARLEHDSLRVHQAMRRAGMEELLGPVVDDHHRLAIEIRRVQAALRRLWDDGQDRRWNG